MPIRQMTKEQILEAQRRLRRGETKRDIARIMNVTRVTLRKILNEYELYGDAALDTVSKPYPTRSKSEERVRRLKGVEVEIHDKKSIWDAVLFGRGG